MSFKENLLKKIRINTLAKTVSDSINPRESAVRIDKNAMRSLLEMGSYKYQKERDLDLYILDSDGEKSRILVLDNELPIYTTTVEDVVLRRSPTVKEMISIRNAIKILSDTDVVAGKRKESVEYIQKDCIDSLDLSFNESDIHAIENEGAAALSGEDAGGVTETLSLFAEILGYRPPPEILMMYDNEIICAIEERASGEKVYGPIVMYNKRKNIIRLIGDQIKDTDRSRLEYVHQVAKGKEKASIEGNGVFSFLKEEVLKEL